MDTNADDYKLLMPVYTKMEKLQRQKREAEEQKRENVSTSSIYVGPSYLSRLTNI